jgi:formylglycine-generating enzyme required for sulfatase activity
VVWLAKKTGKPYRLLSEAEFEYAARGKTQLGKYPQAPKRGDEIEVISCYEAQRTVCPTSPVPAIRSGRQFTTFP